MTIRVVTAADRRYLPYLAAMLASIAAAHREGPEVEITVLSRDLEMADMEACCPRRGDTVRVRAACPLDWLPGEISPHYLRLAVADALPASAQRAIYLDADVIVCSPLSELWERPLGGAVAGAVVDYLGTCRRGISNWRELRVDPDAFYYNSGVLLVDLARWRALNVAAEVLNICELNADHLTAEGEHPQYDQYGLNVALLGQWTTLSSLWNWGAELVAGPGRIVHYVGNGKPGAPRCDARHTEVFLSHLATTRWAGWTPT